jgi:transposase-like protein
VAKRQGISEGVLNTWVSKFKKADELMARDLKALQVERIRLKAELRRTTEERDILKKAALPSCPAGVRVHPSAPSRIPSTKYVPGC